MKKLFTLGIFFLAANILSANKSDDFRVGLSSMPGQEKKLADNDLVLELVIENSRKLLRVSFNGHEGSEGDLKIFNSANENKAEFSFELIRSPHYATVDVTDLLPGNYKVELHTKIAIHTLTLTIQ